jgi:uncharacterized membrane protein
MPFPIQGWQILTAALMLGLTLSIGYTVEQSEFALLYPQYLVWFGLYWGVFQRVSARREIGFFFVVAVLLRLALVAAMPQLSDDVYRFIWDGRLWTQGISPFAQLPAHYLQAGQEVPGLTRALYDQLNSPAYYTIYPPLAQAIFGLGVWLFPGSLYGSTVVMKSVLFLFELGTLWILPKLLRQLKLPARNVLIYALNPLIILELVGNLHFEGVMLFFLLAALWLMLEKRRWLSAVLFGLSAAAKLLSLLFLPLFLRALGWKRLIGYSALAVGLLALLFWPFLRGPGLDHFTQSLDLYFRRFEFNASIYYLLRALGKWQVGYNPIAVLGPALAVATFLIVMGLLIWGPRYGNRALIQNMLFAITAYLLLATTVHPWYLTLSLGLCLFTRYRFPVLWSALIVLTYINYSYEPYRENLWMVALEYALVLGFLAWELHAVGRSSQKPIDA